LIVAVESAWDKLGVFNVLDIQVGRVAAVAFAALKRKGLIVLYILSKAVLMINDAVQRTAN
jgi:hypothetical protein